MRKSNTKEYISEQNKRAREVRISKPINEKEKLIIRMICNELSSEEIAETMDKSIRTVENSRQIIMKKLSCRNSVGVVKYALRNGIYKL